MLTLIFCSARWRQQKTFAASLPKAAGDAANSLIKSLMDQGRSEAPRCKRPAPFRAKRADPQLLQKCDRITTGIYAEGKTIYERWNLTFL